MKTKQTFVLGVIYRTNYCEILTETENDESKLEKYLQKAFQISNNVILIGDLNADVRTGSDCPIGNKTKEIISTYGMTQIIEKPTRIDPITRKSTTIDHVWIDKLKNTILKSGTAQGYSDHFAIFLTINIQKPIKQEKIIQLRNYKNYNPTTFNEELNDNLKKSNINEAIEEKNVNKAMNQLLTILQETTDNHAPMTEMKIKENKNNIPWFTDELIKKIKLKNRLLQDWHLY